MDAVFEATKGLAKRIREMTSAKVADRLGPSDFNMPWMIARADVISADLLLGEIGNVERSWSDAWDAAAPSHGWERWLITGRLASVRADLELERGRLETPLGAFRL